MVEFIDLENIEYKKAWDYQEEIFEKVLQTKLSGENKSAGYFIFCEHPHVYTLGKSGAQTNLLITKEFLEKINATFYQSDRGGDITYHGPGQIVGYPILNLEILKLGIKSYIFNLEEVIIKTLAEYGLNASRLENATGVWLDADNKQKNRKICAIGVKTSRYISMHGFALNVNTDLSYFSYINPCGFVDKGVTSLEKELQHKIDLTEVKEKIRKYFLEIFVYQNNK